MGDKIRSGQFELGPKWFLSLRIRAEAYCPKAVRWCLWDLLGAGQLWDSPTCVCECRWPPAPISLWGWWLLFWNPAPWGDVERFCDLAGEASCEGSHSLSAWSPPHALTPTDVYTWCGAGRAGPFPWPPHPPSCLPLVVLPQALCLHPAGCRVWLKVLDRSNWCCSHGLGRNKSLLSVNECVEPLFPQDHRQHGHKHGLGWPHCVPLGTSRVGGEDELWTKSDRQGTALPRARNIPFPMENCSLGISLWPQA